MGPQVSVHASIYQGNPFWVPIFDPQPEVGCFFGWVRSEALPLRCGPLQPPRAEIAGGGGGVGGVWWGVGGFIKAHHFCGNLVFEGDFLSGP